MIGTAEVMNLGTRLGLEKKMLAHILNISTGRCWSSELYNPCPGVIEGVPSSNEYQGGFGTQLMTKVSIFFMTLMSRVIHELTTPFAHQENFFSRINVLPNNINNFATDFENRFGKLFLRNRPK